MLVALGFGMIAAFMFLIMTKRLSPIVALIIVPTAFGLIAGGGPELGQAVIASIKTAAPTACLLFFAIIFFGMMIDVGLFDPLIKLILRFVKHDPVRLVVGTALLTTIVSLDGDGSTTFIIVTSAFLPLFHRVGMRPWALTCVAATSNGILNTVPWGGSTARAAAALKVGPVDIFVPMIPAVAAGLLTLLGLTILIGLQERRRLGMLSIKGDHVHAAGGVSTNAAAALTQRSNATQTSTPQEPATGGAVGAFLQRPNARPQLVWLNAMLTIGVMSTLVVGALPPAVVFLLAVAVGMIVNFPNVVQQSEQIKSHASSIVGVVGMVFAATVLTGVLSGSGMVEAMAKWLVTVIPESWGPHLALVTGLISIPMTFFTSNDAFYFGVLPILTETASHYGIAPVEMARAALVGQPLHQSSPLVASFLLLVGLAKVELGEHSRKTIWRAILVGLIMLGVGMLTGAFPG